MVLIRFALVIVLVWMLNTLALLNYQFLPLLFFYMMCSMCLILPKIWFLFTNSHLILIPLLSFTPLISLCRIEQHGGFCCTGWVEMGCTFFLLLPINCLHRHLSLLVNVLLQHNGTHAWDILLFVLLIMFFQNLVCLLFPAKLFTLVLLVSVLRVNNSFFIILYSNKFSFGFNSHWCMGSISYLLKIWLQILCLFCWCV